MNLESFSLDIIDMIGSYLSYGEHYLLLFPSKSALLKRRRKQATGDDLFNFEYYMIQLPDITRFHGIFQAHHFDLIFRKAVAQGSIVRLENLKRLNRRLVINCEIQTVHRNSFKWLRKNKNFIAFNDKILLNYMLKCADTSILNILRPFLKEKKVFIDELDNIQNVKILKWFFSRPELLIGANTSIYLDCKSYDEIETWLTLSPVKYSNFIYDSIVDFAPNPYMLDLYFNCFADFNYSEIAITLAIIENNYKVLEWWENREQEGSLKMKLPSEVRVSNSVLSKEVQLWVQKYNIKSAEDCEDL